MYRFKDFDHFEDKVTGMVNLPEIGDITVEFELEDHNGTDDLNGMMEQAESWLEGFNIKVLRDVIKATAAELTDSAYAGSAYLR